MKFILASLLLGLLAFGLISPVWAETTVNAFIPINGDPTTPSYKFSKVIYLDYPNGGKLKDALDGKNMTIQFSEDSANNPSLKSLADSLNSAMKDNGSPATVTDVKLDYKANIQGGPTEATITYFIQLRPTVTNYLLYKGTLVNKAGLQGGGTPFILDASWAAFNLKSDANISTQQYGTLEINHPISLFKKELPDAYNVIKGTDAEKYLSGDLIDASTLYSETPLDKWNAQVDNSYIVSDAASLQFKGQSVSVTTFATGGSSVGSGAETVFKKTVPFTSDVAYQLREIGAGKSSGSVNVQGNAKPYSYKGAPAFESMYISGSSGAATGPQTGNNFSEVILYGMAGGAGGVAIFVFIWSNKRMKADKNRKPEAPWGPVQYEERKHWADKFDDKSAV